jgi:PadR family transcriptional regulator AphA
LVEFEAVSQTGKPDKKVYTITDKGRKALEEWVLVPPVEAVAKDEMTMKVYSMWLTDPNMAKNLFFERVNSYKEKLIRYQKKMIKLLEKNPEKDIMNPDFIHIMLLERGIAQTEQEINWCEQMIERFNNGNVKTKNVKNRNIG